MGRTRQKSIARPLSEEELDDAIDAAQSEGEAYLVRRLAFVKNLYRGDSLNEAGERVGVSSATASRWGDAWNDGDIDALRPNFGGGRPASLSEQQRQCLAAVLETHRPWTAAEVRRFIEEAFGVSYSRRHVSRLLGQLEGNYSIQRRTDRPDDVAEILGRPLEDVLDEL